MPEPTTVPPRWAIYARVSTEEQKEGQTIDSQVSELERFANDRKANIVAVYRDDGWSGAVLARPELDRLRDDAARGFFEAVLINDVDRLARDVAHLGVIKQDLERKQVRILFRKLPDGASPTNNLMVNILASFAEFEREMITDRTRRGKLHKLEVRKQFIGSVAPYGYRYIPPERTSGRVGTLEIVPEEASIVRKIYSWVDGEGLSGLSVVKRLKTLGIRCRKGGPQQWGTSSIFRILHNATYTGTWHYNKSRSCLPESASQRPRYRKHKNTARRRRSEAEWIPLQLETTLQIIDPAQFRRVQERIRQNTTFSKRNEHHRYLLKALVYCGGCGATYVGDPHREYFYYRCSRRCKAFPSIQEPVLNDAVWLAIRNAALNPQLLLSQARLNLASNHAKTQSTSAEKKEGEVLMRQIVGEERRIIQAYRLGAITPTQLGAELEQLHTRKAAASLLLDTKEKSTKPEPVMKATISEFCARAAICLDRMSDDQKRNFLRSLVRRIVFAGSTVRVYGELPLAGMKFGSGEPPPRDSIGGIASPDLSQHGRNPTSHGGIASTDLLQRGCNPTVDNSIDTGAFSGNGTETLGEGVAFQLNIELPNVVYRTRPRQNRVTHR